MDERRRRRKIGDGVRRAAAKRIAHARLALTFVDRAAAAEATGDLRSALDFMTSAAEALAAALPRSARDEISSRPSTSHSSSRSGGGPSRLDASVREVREILRSRAPASASAPAGVPVGSQYRACLVASCRAFTDAPAPPTWLCARHRS